MSNRELIDDLKRAGLYAANNNIGSVMSACDRGAEALEAHEWTPIADAPAEWKDGRLVLVTNVGLVGSGSTATVVAEFWGGHWRAANGGFSLVDAWSPAHLKLIDPPKGGE